MSRVSAALAAVLACAAALVACEGAAPLPPSTPPAPSPSSAEAALPDLRFDVGAIDRRVDPCASFYDYACGGWRASHPIPPSRTRISRYAELEDVNLARERALVEGAATPGARTTAAERRVGATYAACMDERAIAARGLAPAREILGKIDAITSARDAAVVVAELQAHDVSALFDASPDADLHDPKRQVLELDKGRLGLPDPGDYTKTDAKAIALRAGYEAHLARLFQLLGAGAEDAARTATRTVALESALAASALSAAARRRVDARDHPMTLAELGARYAAIDWPAHLAKIGAGGAARVNVAQPAWLDAVNAALASPDVDGLRGYLRLQVARKWSIVLPSPIEDEMFGFDQRTVRGAKEMAPRWRRCLSVVDRDVGDDVGRLFVAKHFPPEARARAKAMIDALVVAYRADIAASEWLGPAARAAADAKLTKMLVVIGASNRPRDLDGLAVAADDAFGNAWRARALAATERMADLARPTDRERFFDALPQDLDGFGSKALVATGFTAGFLQPPVFDARLDDAVNFGGLGSVIGHELSHQLDDEGRKYDAEGDVHGWWSPDDVARFEERAQCFVDEYARFKLEDGTPLDGKLTLGENIADNGGIRLSYAASKPSDVGPKVDGFTPAQRFFLAWGQIRCENVTPETARRQAESDPHAAGRFRVDGVVSNMPEFARAFACADGAPMAPAKRCRVW